MPDPKAKHYPSTRYHPKHGAVRVESEEHEAETAHPDKGWAASPAGFPDADPTKCATCGQALPGVDADATDVATDAKPKRAPKAPRAE